jgi:hypothetical protein
LIRYIYSEEVLLYPTSLEGASFGYYTKNFFLFVM